MTLDAGGSAIGAGWFPDPAGSPWLRWWDGAGWSEHFLDPATGAPPQAGAVPQAAAMPQASGGAVAASVPVAAAGSTSDGGPTAESVPVTSAAAQATNVPLTRREMREQQADLHAETTPIAVPVTFDHTPSESYPAASRFDQLLNPASTAAPTQAAPLPAQPDPLSAQAALFPEQAGSFAPAASVPPSAFVPSGTAVPSAASVPPAAFVPSGTAVPSAASVPPAAEMPPGGAMQPGAAMQSSDDQQTLAPFAPTLSAPAFGQNWVTAPAPKMEDAYFPPRGEHPYVPMVNPRTTYPQAAQEVEPGAVSTGAVWLFAVLPVLHVALAWFVVERLKVSDLGAVRWAIIAGPIVIYLILAAVDRRTLLGRGHVNLASALLAIIPPLYLGIRATRMGARAVAPALVWLALQAAGIAVLILLFPAVVTQLTAADVSTAPTLQPAPTAATHVLTPAERAALLTPAGMAAELKTEFASKGVALTSVTCPQLANTTDGTQVTCLGVLPISKLDILVSVDNVNTLAAFDIINSTPHQGD